MVLHPHFTIQLAAWHTWSESGHVPAHDAWVGAPIYGASPTLHYSACSMAHLERIKSCASV
eukprot:1145002-Pelagomonas_calceolata.AAC.1